MGRRAFIILSVMPRDEFGLMSRIWLGRWRGGAVMGVENGDLDEVGRAFGPGAPGGPP